MKRSPMKRHARRDPVTPELRAAVLERDLVCTLARLDPTHECRDRWGLSQPPSWDLTIEHVKSESRMGRRALSDLQHLVAMCYGGNVGVPSAAQRQAIRAYLAQVAS
jgi:hypothetical protein